jgi:cytochrome c peroxidase
LGFADGRPVAIGVAGKKGIRNSPTVLNAVYHATQFLDGRVDSLEEQASGPVTNPVEMANTLTAVEHMLNADPGYRSEFERAFGPGDITFEKAAKAIAAFERTLVCGDSPFDRFRFGGEETALSEEARRGWEVFRDPGKGNCTICHLVGVRTAPLTDGLFHNTGAGLDDLGRYNVTGKERDRGAFKTPTLRNVALTAPYMHDGSLATLRAVIDFYALGGTPNPHLDPDIRPLPLSEQDRLDLVAFLKSLTSLAARATDSSSSDN